MTGPGFDATLGTIDGAAGPLNRADTELQTFADTVKAGTAEAAGGAGEGPLSGALNTLGTDGSARAGERGDECHELAQALHESAEEYRARDDAARSGIGGVTFGGVGG